MFRNAKLFPPVLYTIYYCRFSELVSRKAWTVSVPQLCVCIYKPYSYVPKSRILRTHHELLECFPLDYCIYKRATVRPAMTRMHRVWSLRSCTLKRRGIHQPHHIACTLLRPTTTPGLGSQKIVDLDQDYLSGISQVVFSVKELTYARQGVSYFIDGMIKTSVQYSYL